MSARAGSVASNSTDDGLKTETLPAAPVPRPVPSYLQGLAQRRAAERLRQQTGYGLVVGWILALVAGFCYCCVPGPVDWLWAALFVIGVLHLVLAVVLPQALDWPERGWRMLAHWQGKLVMAVLLTMVYFALFWPASLLRRRHADGFQAWDDLPPDLPSGWRPFVATEFAADARSGNRRRSLPILMAGVIGFFFRRGHYVLLPILILLLILGLILFFVQSSALAPFIYTLF